MQHAYNRTRLLAGLLPQDFQDVACKSRIEVGHRLLAAGHLGCATVDVRGETQMVQDLKRLGAVGAREAR